MGLTGGLFFDTLIVLTVLLVGLVVLFWSSLAGSGVVRLLLRLGALVVINALVLLTAAVKLNDTYLFFASWGDVQGALTGHFTATRVERGAKPSDALRARVQGRAAVAAAHLPALPARDIAPGGLVDFRVHGPASGLTGAVYVQLPPGYRQGSARTYPVLETFGGYPGQPTQWIRVMNVGGVLHELAVRHRIRDAIVVSPQVQFPNGVDTECVNGGRGGVQVETWATKDVPQFIADTLHVDTHRSAWATIGLSAGAYCSAMTAMRHPAQYGAAIVMGGYFHPEFGPYYKPFTAKHARGYDLVHLAEHRPPPVAMWLETSHSDQVSYQSSAKMLRAVRPPMAMHTVVLRNAGHWIGLWQQLLPGALRWLGANVSGFRGR